MFIFHQKYGLTRTVYASPRRLIQRRERDINLRNTPRFILNAQLLSVPQAAIAAPTARRQLAH